jgi:CBS domain-containing protein
MKPSLLTKEPIMSERLTAGAICTRSVITAFRSTAVNEAARLMREQHVGCLVIVDETDVGRVVVGMLTDRDIVMAIVAHDLDARTLRVEDVMSVDLATAREEDSLMDLIGSMRHKGVRRVPVVDARRVLVGLVSLDDVLESIVQELSSLVETIAVERKRENVTRP